nr:glycoside hydrolase family 88 protein [Paenibacillus sp.]
MNRESIADVMRRLEPKVDRMIEGIGERSPHFADASGAYDDRRTDWWTSGFWPGILWLMYDVTGKEHYKEAAWPWDETLDYWLSHPTEDTHHDVGFQYLQTAVVKYMITGDSNAKRIGLNAANYLAGRYNPAGRFIRAWNGDKNGWAIIDCMMNVSLLFWASETTGDPRYKHIAMSHADTAARVFIRDDGSSNHIAVFDAETGEFREALGGQGYAADSAWSRGAAWALNGFANTYRRTGERRYLDTAKRVAHFFLSALPEDKVPYWDFRLPTLEGEPRDTSAAAIAASGLLEIADAVPEGERRLYLQGAHDILQSLTERYATWDRPDSQAILTGATGHKPAGQYVDGSLIYGDYYYIEAIAKLYGWERRVY